MADTEEKKVPEVPAEEEVEKKKEKEEKAESDEEKYEEDEEDEELIDGSYVTFISISWHALSIDPYFTPRLNDAGFDWRRKNAIVSIQTDKFFYSHFLSLYDSMDDPDELQDLEDEANLTVEELRAKYKGRDDDEEEDFVPDDDDDDEPIEGALFSLHLIWHYF